MPAKKKGSAAADKPAASGATATTEKKTRVFVDAIKFATTYKKFIEDGKKIKDIALALGMAEMSVNKRAMLMRQKGVKLPAPERKRSPLDVNAINAALANGDGE